MALANGLRIVWLDAYIGQDGECHAFKRRFQDALEPAAAVPPSFNDIDRLIYALNQHAAPFIFVNEPDEAIKTIRTHHDKQIIFISSGSLGRNIIPDIIANYSYVYRYYIFCGNMTNYVEFGLEYISCLQMFDHETDLLVRLSRDVSNDIIKQGQIYLRINDGEDALTCFEHAITLNNTANEIDTLNGSYLAQLKILLGDDNNIGLIQRARDMINQQ